MEMCEMCKIIFLRKNLTNLEYKYEVVHTQQSPHLSLQI